MTTDTVTIFTGGDQLQPDLADDLPPSELVIAADSGYDAAVGLGHAVDVLIGDLDSVASEIPQHVVVQRHPADKDQTDLELALELCMREQPLRVVVVGGSGGRLDHELAIANLLGSSRWAPTEIDWINNRSRSHVVRERRLIHADVGATISLIPVGGNAKGIQTKGLRWDLDGETLYSDHTRGISNVMRAPVVDIRLTEGCVLAVLPTG